MSPSQPKASIGVIGGSGFYSLLKKPQSISIHTPYGPPSSSYALGRINGKNVAFLPRHGPNHQYPPHQIPYRANLYGFKQLGVKFIISPCATGSLQSQIKPGDFVICDQFIDRTKNRPDTFFEGPKTIHISCDQPYCPKLRQLAIKISQKLNYPLHPKGTIVVINGPRFSTHAESLWFRSQNWHVIGMTQYPEVVLAKELEICFVNISLITDYDTGVKTDKNSKPVTTQEVIKIFKKNNRKVKIMISEMIKNININKRCSCHQALKSAAI